MAAACRRVPGLPARSFHEAVQSIWFLDFVLHAVCGARDYSAGRLDQILFPLYRQDLASAALTREDAVELLQSMFIKMNAFIGIHDHYTSPVKRSLCRDSVQYLVVGGQTAEGRDATNELSLLCLDAVDDLRLKEPNLTVRHHPVSIARSGQRLRRRAPGREHRGLQRRGGDRLLAESGHPTRGRARLYALRLLQPHLPDRSRSSGNTSTVS